jgi:uncharacterized protein
MTSERPLGRRCGLTVPRVSIGAMRLPSDPPEGAALVRHALDSGMKYIDTSRGYGPSEGVLAHALRGEYRERAVLSTKWSPWNIKVQPDDDTSAACIRRRIEEQLQRLQVDVLDFYQLWSLFNAEQWESATGPNGMLEGIQKARDDGLVRHIGFTTHDSPKNVIAQIADADWCEVILLTYNMLGREYAPVLAAAHAAGIGTLVMNPVAGGLLTESSPALDPLVQEIGAESLPDLAIRYVLGNPDVDSLLCGMSKMSDVDDTMASAARAPLTPGQMARVEEFMDALSGKSVGFCTGCKYCMPCPQGINIPAIMACIHNDRFLGLSACAKRNYHSWIVGNPKADACTRCGQCEEKCTQHLPIMDEMQYAVERFGESKKP